MAKCNENLQTTKNVQLLQITKDAFQIYTPSNDILNGRAVKCQGCWGGEVGGEGGRGGGGRAYQRLAVHLASQPAGGQRGDMERDTRPVDLKVHS